MRITKKFVLSVVFTLLGTSSAMIPHVMMQTMSHNSSSDEPHFFKKPHFISLLQFLGTALVIIVFFIKTCAYKYDSNYSVSTHQRFWSFVLKVSVISVFEVVSTSLMFMSLTNMPISTWQILRGTIQIFDFVLMKLFYKKRVAAYQLCGIIITAVGIMAVSIEFIISCDSSSIGIATSYSFSILAQFFQSCKSLIETKYLVDPSDSTEMIYGVEGIISSIISIVIILPTIDLIGGDEGFFSEKISDTADMLYYSRTLKALSIIYVAVVAGYLIASTYLIDIKSKYKSILGTVRSLIILVLSPLSHLFNVNYGRSFTLSSILFVPGAVLVLFGILISDGVIKITWFDYPPDSDSGNADYDRIMEDDSPLILQSEVSNV
jgi:drug/metabolite transporter (DMT)-like permease